MIDFNHSCTFDAFHPDNRPYAIGGILCWVQMQVAIDPELRIGVRIYPVPYMAETLRQTKPFIIHIFSVEKLYAHEDCRLWG